MTSSEIVEGWPTTVKSDAGNDPLDDIAKNITCCVSVTMHAVERVKCDCCETSQTVRNVYYIMISKWEFSLCCSFIAVFAYLLKCACVLSCLSFLSQPEMTLTCTCLVGYDDRDRSSIQRLRTYKSNV